MRYFRLLSVALFILSTANVSGGAHSTIENQPRILPPFLSSTDQEMAFLAGNVSDMSGSALADVSVLLCGSACWLTSTAKDGSFRFENVPPERYRLEVRGHLVASRSLSTVVFPIQLVAGEQRLPTLIRLLDIVSGPLADTRTTLKIEGLSLKPEGVVNFAALTQASKTKDNPQIGAALVPSTDWPNYSLKAAGSSYTPVTMWALSPFGIDLGGPVSAQVDIQTDVPMIASKYAFFSVDPLTGEAQWLSQATLDGSNFRTTAGHGVQILTWLILAVQV